MNRRIWTGIEGGRNYYPAVIICGALFICGCIAGAIAAGLISDGGSLSEYMSEYIRAAEGGEVVSPAFADALISAAKYHLLAAFLGFSMLGVVCLPAVSAVRGFFLCFSISAVVRLFGSDGIMLALALFGIGALLTIPSFLVLCVQSFYSSFGILKCVSGRSAGRQTCFGDGFFVRLIICFVFALISATAESFWLGNLVRAAAQRIM